MRADVGTLLASGAKDRRVRLWSQAGACLAQGGDHAGAVSALAFSRRGPAFLVSGGADKLLKARALLLPLAKAAHDLLPSSLPRLPSAGFLAPIPPQSGWVARVFGKKPSFYDNEAYGQFQGR